MSENAQIKSPSALFYILALAGIIIVLGASRISNFDVWWHLKTGELIYKWWSIPQVDFFSYTAVGSKWVNHESLFQVFIWLLYKGFGVVSLVLLKFFLTVLISLFAFRTINILALSRSIALWGTFFLLYIVSDRIMIKPSLFSLVFLIFYLNQIYKFLLNKQKHLWLLPLFQIIWINIHAGGLTGIFLLLVFAIGESVQVIFYNRFSCNDIFCLTKNKCLHLWFIVLLTIFASVINPTGIEVLYFSFSHFNMSNIILHTQEWLPVWDSRLNGIVSQILFRILLALVLLSYLLNRKRVRFSYLFLTALSCAMILKGKRFTADFGIINIPLFCLNLKEFFSKYSFLELHSKKWQWVHIVLVTFLSLNIVLYGYPVNISFVRINDIGLNASKVVAPEDLVKFLDDNKIYGNVFNEMGIGGYLLFKRWPFEKVFIDGRTPVYGDKFYKDFVQSFYQEKNFVAQNKKYNFDYIVLKGDQAWNLRHFHKYLWQHPEWKLVYYDFLEGMVYLRNKPKFRYLINKYSYDSHPMFKKDNRPKK